MQIQSNLGSTIAMAFDECPQQRGKQGVCAEFCRPHYQMAGALQEGDGQTEQPAGYGEQGAAAFRNQSGCYL